MAKIDEIKAWLDFLNRLLSIGLVTLLGIVGWLFLHYETAGTVLIASALVGIVMLSALLVLLAKKIVANIEKLKDLP